MDMIVKSCRRLLMIVPKAPGW